MTKKTYIVFTFLVLSLSVVFSQKNGSIQRSKDFSISITIVDEDNTTIDKNVEIFSSGKFYAMADVNGKYNIRGKIGDEIRVSHPDFETVYYTLISSDDIRILVEDSRETKRRASKFTSTLKRADFYLQHLDSAKFFKNKDIEKSMYFIEKALKSSQNKKRNAITYKVLADVYLFWKQYDLAVFNYKISYQINVEVNTKIALAQAQFLLMAYEESNQTYQALMSETLSNYEEIEVFEGLGDVLFAEKKWDAANINYQKALKIANENAVTSKVTDISSKVAEVFASKGNINKAKNLFINSLSLAEKENLERALEEEEKVADFYSNNRNFDDEITLRKKSLVKTEQQNSSKKSTKEKDSITSQKINYKIGYAYILKEDYKGAIPFLKKSKEVANNKEDIVIQKDATRKLSEVYATIGDENNALKNYKEYVKLVDELYIKKEQEIQQAKRFSKKIAANQNRIASLEKDKELTQSKISLDYVDQKLSEESNRRQRQIIYSLIVGFLLMSLLLYFMYRTNKQQKLANNLLALKSMRSQMNPHFIFNALNSVNSFIAVNDERNANRYLSEFSVLMRSVLENSDEDFIPLTKEIELLELYVKLEHNRFRDKFDYQIIIDKTIDVAQFEIPPMLLQPYIENAIWHGLRYRTEKGTLEISITKKDTKTVSILIIDDGIGRKKSQELKTKNQLRQKSKGMSTIKDRITILNSMYKERISVDVSDVLETGEGTKVELLLRKK